MVYMHDVAHVHDGSAVQTNIVHVDGNRSVLLSVFKNGTTSTLRHRQRHQEDAADHQALAPRLRSNIKPIADQSMFVRASIQGVIREGVIAAALTSLMILLFLGSARSTLIVTTSIPLSILGAIAALSAIGETLNIMTLGGLALAVGILVDEATVTIESINYHLEQGKEVGAAILDGASQIVVPAFVSLLCICIVFIPMFFLSGVARFLFVPMAESVMFAMVFSFLLSRTLVPTMAKYLLRRHAMAASAAGRWRAPPPSRNPLVRFQRGFEARFARLRAGYRELLALAMRAPRTVRCGLPRLRRGLVPAGAVSRPQFLPAGGRRPDTAARAGAGRHAHRGDRRALRRGRECDPPDDSAGRGRQRSSTTLAPICRRSIPSTTTPARSGSRTETSRSRSTRVMRPPPTTSACLRKQLPRRFPGMTFSFLPADIVSQILNFGAPAPIDLQVRGNDLPADYAYANGLLPQIRARHGRGRRAHPAVGRAADASTSTSIAPARNIPV